MFLIRKIIGDIYDPTLRISFIINTNYRKLLSFSIFKNRKNETNTTQISSTSEYLLCFWKKRKLQVV